MGWPTSGELGTPNGQGRFNRFEHGNIYFGFPVGRAHMIHGAIFNRYGQEGYEGVASGSQPAMNTKSSETADSYKSISSAGGFSTTLIPVRRSPLSVMRMH